MSQNPVVHFEMGYFDSERAKKFYETAFGWKMKKLGPAIGDYLLARTAETDESGLVTTPGTINGGFSQKTEDPISHSPTMVISVPDIHAAIKAVKAARGQILGTMDENQETSMEPQLIPGVGYWIRFLDTENNRVGMLQPVNM